MASITVYDHTAIAIVSTNDYVLMRVLRQHNLLLSFAAGRPRTTEGSDFGFAAAVAQLLPTRTAKTSAQSFRCI
jgi:hypothetical protein